VDKNGINPVPVISKTGKPHSIRVGFDIVSRGEIIASPNGKYVANAVSGGDVGGWLELFDFDVETGILNNPKLLSDKIPKDILISGFYSVKFSPDNSKLYAAHYSQPLFQFDLMNLDSPPLQIDPPKVSRLQLAPDGKIYGNLNYPPDGFVYPEDNGKYLCIINKPNELGIECGFVEKGIYLGENALAHISLPNFIQSYFYQGNDISGADFTTSDLCVGNLSQFNATSKANIQQWRWDFGDPKSGSLNYSSQQNPSHMYQQAGLYNVRLLATNKCGVNDTVPKMVSIYDDPVIDIGRDSISVCYDQVPVTLDVFAHPNTDYLWSNGITSPGITIDKTGWHKVTATNGCNNRSDSVYLYVIPKAIAYIPDDTIVCDGNFALLDAKNSGSKFLWSTGEISQFIKVDVPGKYWVTIENDCSLVTDSTNLVFISEQLGFFTTNVLGPMAMV
jgi:PKD repeat protein